MIRVAHLSFSEGGGAGLFASRLNAELSKSDVASEHLFVTTNGAEKLILRRPALFLASLIDYLLVRTNNKSALFTIIRSRLSGLRHNLQYTDVLHIHWLPGCLSARDLQRLRKSGTAIVWTLHDMWPVTGGCHQSGNCDRYRSGCKACPQARRPFRPMVQRRKQTISETWSGSHLGAKDYFISPARWLADVAVESGVDSSRVEVIPNFVDTEMIRSSATTSRAELSLRDSDFVAVVIANNLDDPNKGVHEMVTQLSRRVSETKATDLKVLLLGRSRRTSWPAFVRHVNPEAQNENIFSLMKLADVVLGLSDSETLPTVIIEAITAGVVPLCINNKGYQAIVNHQEHGLIFDNRVEMAEFLSNDARSSYNLKDLAKRCREASDKYSKAEVISRHVDVYRRLVTETTS